MNAESAGAHLEACPFCGADHDEATLRCPATDMVLPFEGRMLAGKFRLVSELGRGGMGAVWRGRNVHVDREVALKLILPEALKNKEIVARFQNEARVAARIGHPGICDILDLETSALGPVIVMELLRGENLGQRIAREGTLAPTVAVALIREALHALDAAHRAGIIHRDLKPENLFIHQPETGPAVVKLMDFGISKFIDRDGALTGSGVLMGTPEYMAPEQINGAVYADARTDIWAIGAVLYKAITGVDPFTAASVPATLIAIITAEPEPVDARVPGVPSGLSAVILRCLAKSQTSGSRPPRSWPTRCSRSRPRPPRCPRRRRSPRTRQCSRRRSRCRCRCRRRRRRRAGRRGSWASWCSAPPASRPGGTSAAAPTRRRSSCRRSCPRRSAPSIPRPRPRPTRRPAAR
ncbi:serine/threonine-protein kinase [Nannocystis pusilla]|uniref:serine/threonine-protein kinase n=1 Tax=Nannocystis pusilla TaxID=889268 RepID=UPI003B7D24E5